MVERIHAGILKSLVVCPAVPALPYRRCALRHGVEPGGPCFLVQKFVSNIDAPVPRQHVREIRRSHEAGGKVHATRLDVAHKFLNRRRAQMLRQQIEMQRKHVRGLRATRDAACRGYKLPVECLADFFKLLFKPGRLCVFAKRLRDASEQPRAIRVKSGADQRIGRTAKECSAPVQREPVAEAAEHARIVTAHAIAAGFCEVIYKPVQRLVVLIEKARVTVAEVDRPRANDCGVLPCRTAIRRKAGCAARGGDPRRYGSILRLRIGDVGLPFREEPRDIHVERRRADEHLGVTHPSQPLVALRAIGWHFEEIPALPPLDVVLKLIDERIGALEVARRGCVGMEHHTSHLQQLDFCAERNIHIAEAVESEPRFPCFLAVAAERVTVDGTGRAQIFSIELSIFIQHFSVPDVDRRAARAAHFQPHTPDHILVHVVNAAAGNDPTGRVFAHLFRLDFLNSSHWRAILRNPCNAGIGNHFHFGPFRVVEPSLGPVGHFKARIVALTHEHVRLEDRTRRCLP